MGPLQRLTVGFPIGRHESAYCAVAMTPPCPAVTLTYDLIRDSMRLWEAPAR